MFSTRLFSYAALAGFAVLFLWAPRSVCAQAAAFAIADQTTGTILDSVNAQKKLQIGSLTKIASTMVVLDWASATGTDVSQLAVIPESARALATGSGVNFQVGDRCSLRDLLYASMMQSDNQAAQALSEHVGRALAAEQNVPASTAFVSQMNALARRLGMLNTRFLNAHGLDTLERTLPYSTASDLVKLTTYAMANSAFRFYASQQERKITIHAADGSQTQYLLRNTNELVGKNAVDGVKTGTTRRAGQCVIISAARPPESRQEGERFIITPRRLNVVVLGSQGDRFPVAAGLLDRGWQLHQDWAAAGRPQIQPKKR